MVAALSDQSFSGNPGYGNLESMSGLPAGIAFPNGESVLAAMEQKRHRVSPIERDDFAQQNDVVAAGEFGDSPALQSCGAAAYERQPSRAFLQLEPLELVRNR